MVYQLFGQAAAHLCDRFVREQVFPLESDRVYYLPSRVFAWARLNFVPVTTGSLTLLSTVLNPVTLWCLLRKVSDPVSGSLRKLHTALSSLQDLEQSPFLEPVAPMEAAAGFDLLTLNVQHTVKTKVVALRQLLQW